MIVDVKNEAKQLSSSIDDPALSWVVLETQIDDFIIYIKNKELKLSDNSKLQTKLLLMLQNKNLNDEIKKNKKKIEDLMYSLVAQYGQIVNREKGGRKSRRAKQIRKKQTKRRKYKK